MNFRRWVGAMALAAAFLGLADVADAQVFFRRRAAVYSEPVATDDATVIPSASAYAVYPYYPYAYYPYVLPLPAYGILPPPLASYYRNYGAGAYGTTDGYRNTTDQLDYFPRQRPTTYPAIPFEKSEVRLSDLRRVRYEITVPFADATVLIDGLKTKQSGLRRVFVTPPLDEDKEYTTTVVVQWTDDTKTLRTRQRTFTVVAGETILHTFVE